MRKSPGYQPIARDDDWFAGEDQPITFTVFDEDTRRVKDITGYGLEFRLSSTEGGPSILTLDAVVDADQVANKGLCRVMAFAEDTETLAPATYHYQLIRINPGSVGVVAFGPAVLQGMST